MMSQLPAADNNVLPGPAAGCDVMAAGSDVILWPAADSYNLPGLAAGGKGSASMVSYFEKPVIISLKKYCSCKWLNYRPVWIIFPGNYRNNLLVIEFDHNDETEGNLKHGVKLYYCLRDCVKR
jgi:hypothetical protein